MQQVSIRPRSDRDQALLMRDAKLTQWQASDVLWMGVDPSLTACGVAMHTGARLKTFVLTPEVQVPGARPGTTRKEMLRGPARLAWFRDEFTRLFRAYRPNGLAIEGYAFGAKNGREALGELGGVLRLAAHDCRLRTIVVPPNTLRMFATGKGNGAKGVVIKEAYKRWGVDVSDDNEADATVLSFMAHAFHSQVPGLTAFQTEALTKVERL